MLDKTGTPQVIRSEMIRFLRAKSALSSTDNIDCQRVAQTIMTMYCTAEWPVMLYSTESKYGGLVRPEVFELVVLHGSIYEDNFALVNQALNLLGVGVSFKVEGDKSIAELKNAPKVGDREVPLEMERLPEYDGLIEGHVFYKVARIIGAKNRRFAWWKTHGKKPYMVEVL